MTAPFDQIIDRWHDAFLLTGTAAVTLVGLLFVALSFNLDVLLHDSRAHLLDFARQAFMGFLYVLVVSLFGLAPGWHQRPYGITLIMMGIILLVLSLRTLASLRRRGRDPVAATRVAGRLAFVLLGSVLLIVSGWLIRGGDTDSLLYVMVALLVLLASGAGGAWDLLVRVGKVRQELSGRE